ncbi:hypothetical protein GH714_019190 [Hevea brasiliensis]|uniref:Protein kinase domain-containing protein n=1 Tax=Hevea brasiliensis TaxID=3981 RepID=A0A6A6LSW2_HEVBR|nr:hypothetical protein GH714_019190 [Hevea brasiliensis]
MLKVPDTTAAIWVDMSMSRQDCEQECKRNYSCSAFASIPIAGSGTGCLAWYEELIDIIDLSDNSGYDLYVLVDALELAEFRIKSNLFLQKKELLAILLPSLSSAWLVIIILIYFYFCRGNTGIRNNWLHKKIFDSSIGSNYYEDSLEENGLRGSRNQPDLIYFDFSTILTATDNFSETNIFGQGSFGAVYNVVPLVLTCEGKLSNGQEIAVKRMSKNSRQGIREFKDEVMLTAKLQHRNLVKLMWDLWTEGKTLEIVDSSLEESHNPHETLRCIQFEVLCVQETIADRPTVSTIVLMLSSEITLPSPKQPSFNFRNCSNMTSSRVGDASCSEYESK